MRKFVTITAASILAAIPTAALAEHHEEGPTIRENAEYMEVVLVDIKAGKRNRAEEIIENYFQKASKAAGTPMPYLVHLQTGEWDFIVAFDLKDGPIEYTYTGSPNRKKWWAAMVEIAGGEKQAQAVWDEYQSLIVRSTSMLGHHHNDEE
ncbi:hypothetical protein [Erythrobacter sp.]|uniref:hypothetical protein n=1 Tax=Erythrobacter sp. TaxID=1042 RepID=UPI00311F8276